VSVRVRVRVRVFAKVSVCCVEVLLGDYIWCVWHRVWVFVRLCVSVSACM